MDKYIGELLDGRYEILEIIGTGGMAVVYKALCHRLNRLVAVKILKDEFLHDDDFRRRFHAESQAVAMLSHTNIVSVFDVSKTGDVEYIVMELIDGLTLKQYMSKKGRLNWREALHFTTQIAKALEHAHSRGIIHRDIKPHNIMILRDGSVKVADFGIARFTSSQNTLTQEALGSVHYISPEQAKGGRVDNRSDIYSLGVVMYEMTTGRLPFEGDSPVAVAIQHISSIPLAPRDLSPDIPEGLEAITMRAMASDIDKRYASTTDMLVDLEEFRKNPDISYVYSVANYSNELLSEPTRSLKDVSTAITSISKKTENTRRKKLNNKKLPIIAIAAVVLLLIVGSVFFIWTYLLGDSMSTPDKLTVPALVGLEVDDVLSDDYYDEYTIKEADDRQYSDTYDEGYIMAQDPEAYKTIYSGRTITVTVSKGKEKAQMPDLVNLEYREAINQINALGLNVTISPTSEVSDSIVADHVIRTEPVAGADIKDGDTVTIVLSDGPELIYVNVPTLVGQTQENAVRAAESAGLVCGSITSVANDAEAGVVVSQSLEPNSSVEKGTTINLQISQGTATPSPSPSETVSPSPTETTSIPPTDSGTTETQVTKSIVIQLPQDKASVVLTIKLDGEVYLEEPVDTSLGSIIRYITSSGTKTLDIYFDWILYKSDTVEFTS